MSLFSRNNFQHTIKDFCRRCNLKISEINDSGATLIFEMQSGQEQFLYIVPYESTLEFSVPSALAFAQLEEIPHELSTRLLQRSSAKTIGFWCIEEIGGQYVYSFMHNAEMQLITADYFGKIVSALVLECEKFELELRKLMNRYPDRRWGR